MKAESNFYLVLVLLGIGPRTTYMTTRLYLLLQETFQIMRNFCVTEYVAKWSDQVSPFSPCQACLFFFFETAKNSLCKSAQPHPQIATVSSSHMPGLKAWTATPGPPQHFLIYGITYNNLLSIYALQYKIIWAQKHLPFVQLPHMDKCLQRSLVWLALFGVISCLNVYLEREEKNSYGERKKFLQRK